MAALPRSGEVVRLSRAASVQFAVPILFRVIRVHDWPTYDGWAWLDGYELNSKGYAVDRRSVFVQVDGIQHAHITMPYPRIVSGGAADRAIPTGKYDPRGNRPRGTEIPRRWGTTDSRCCRRRIGRHHFMIDRHSGARTRLATLLTDQGHLPDPEWRTAFAQVPRHLFVPRFFLPTEDGRWQAIDEDHPDYVARVYSDTMLTTQLDGGADPMPMSGRGPVPGVGTSSSTQPSLMAFMLDALQLTGVERVLEVGTGTGFNAALLCQRLGDDRVTPVEVDAVIADRARTRLASCGYFPAVVTGDGTDADTGIHDRVIGTCAVPTVPPSWIRRTRDGGLIVAPLWRDLGGGALVRLEVNDGTAQGFFLPQYGAFMPVRSVRQTTPALAKALKQVGEPRTAKVGGEILSDEQAGLWVALLVPEVTWLGFTPQGGTPQPWLFAADGSWSMLDEATMRVEQHGPRHLWDEVENAHHLWEGSGAPNRDRMGLTVTPDGTHRFWLDTPEEELWSDTTSM